MCKAENVLKNLFRSLVRTWRITSKGKLYLLSSIHHWNEIFFVWHIHGLFCSSDQISRILISGALQLCPLAQFIRSCSVYFLQFGLLRIQSLSRWNQTTLDFHFGTGPKTPSSDNLGPIILLFDPVLGLRWSQCSKRKTHRGSIRTDPKAPHTPGLVQPLVSDSCSWKRLQNESHDRQV